VFKFLVECIIGVLRFVVGKWCCLPFGQLMFFGWISGVFGIFWCLSGCEEVFVVQTARKIYK
jgi:hypothetical protein